ncbi:hypothetical protein, partial [Leisingera sp. MMG026]|uniref:hypothetical protein n=1 Tax=Leisingera sp. MMG026 TaxID=2909982 RepID=UPI001F36210E
AEADLTGPRSPRESGRRKHTMSFATSANTGIAGLRTSQRSEDKNLEIQSLNRVADVISSNFLKHTNSGSIHVQGLSQNQETCGSRQGYISPGGI